MTALPPGLPAVGGPGAGAAGGVRVRPGYTADMSIPRLISLVAASLLATVAATAQEAAVMKKGSASVMGPVAAMRHVGARTMPAPPAVAAVAASARTATVRAARVLPVHFRH